MRQAAMQPLICLHACMQTMTGFGYVWPCHSHQCRDSMVKQSIKAYDAGH